MSLFFVSDGVAGSKKELTEKLQNETEAHFFDHTMHDINDALTSILALCDMEEMEQIPKVKGHIQRVNELLNSLKVYQTAAIFNLNHLLKNILSLFSGKFKERVRFSHSFFIKRALCSVDRKTLENDLMAVLIEIIPDSSDSEGPHPLNLSLSQWGKCAQITFTRKDHILPVEAFRRIEALWRASSEPPTIQVKNGHTEVSLFVPLHFNRDFAPRPATVPDKEWKLTPELAQKRA